MSGERVARFMDGARDFAYGNVTKSTVVSSIPCGFKKPIRRGHLRGATILHHIAIKEVIEERKRLSKTPNV